MPVNNFTFGPNGLQLLKSFETKRNIAYDDARPNYVLKAGDQVLGRLTIGWGHTGGDVYIGLYWTDPQCDANLERDIQPRQAFVNQHVTVAIDQLENDALVVIVYNIGEEAFGNSTLLRDLNAGNFDEAAQQFERWDHAAGKVLAGLLRRRLAEEALFKEGQKNDGTQNKES